MNQKKKIIRNFIYIQNIKKSIDNNKFYVKVIIVIIFIMILSKKSFYFIINNRKLNLNKQLKIINNNKTDFSVKPYINYINICEKLIRLNRIKIRKKYPFLSICVPIYNVDKYIEKSLLSIINQSFQNFEIIIINDFSNDNSNNILEKMQKEDNRIKIINHNQNLGVYHSRVEAVLNSNGKYILFFDPDDMLLNENLFKELYNYSLYYNLDIIEFLVYNQKNGINKIYYSKNHMLNHNHRFNTNIVYQPELSNIIFYKPRTKIFSIIICRTIWNKIYKREIQLKTIQYIGRDYYNKYLIVADDTLLNVINFNFSNNYSNINIPGYLYNIKKNSMSRGMINKEHRIKQDISFFFFFLLLYRNIKEFDRDRHFLYYELKSFKKRLLDFKTLNIFEYIDKLKIFLNDIKNDSKSFNKLKNLVKDILLFLNEKK